MRNYLGILFIFFSIYSVAQNKIGININNPVFELDMRTTIATDGADLNIANSTNTHFLRLFSGKDGSSFTNPTIYWNASDSLVFGQFNGSFTELARFKPNGDFIVRGGGLGLGILNPETELHLLDSIGNAQLSIESAADGLASIFLTSTTNTNVQDHWGIIRDGIDGRLKFKHANLDRMTLKQGGFLGLGTTDPQAELHIQDLDGWSRMIIESESGGDAVLQLTDGYTSLDSDWTIQLDGSNFDNLTFRNFNNPIMTMNTNGWIAIGPNNPQTKLDVAGRIRSSFLSGNENRPVVANENGELIISTRTNNPLYWSASGYSCVSTDPDFVASVNTYINSTTSQGEIIIPVHLPDDRIVTNFQVHFQDNSFANDLRFRLRWQRHPSPGVFTMAELNSSSANAGIQSLSTNVINHANSGNRFGTYYIIIEPLGSSTWDGGNMYIRAVDIAYTLIN